MEVFESLKANLVGKNARIVLPEGEEPRILQAAKRIVNTYWNRRKCENNIKPTNNFILPNKYSN